MHPNVSRFLRLCPEKPIQHPLKKNERGEPSPQLVLRLDPHLPSPLLPSSQNVVDIEINYASARLCLL